MSPRACLDTIERNTGKTPADFRTAAETRSVTPDGMIATNVKATQITDWLKADNGMGRGRATPLHVLFKGLKREGDA